MNSILFDSEEKHSIMMFVKFFLIQFKDIYLFIFIKYNRKFEPGVGKVKLSVLKIVSLFLFVIFLNNLSAQGRLTVITDPQGVEVWLGENFLGNSPIVERQVESGRYLVKLVDPVQRVSHEEHIMITTGQTITIDRKMQRRFGTLSVSTTPENAEVYLTVPLGSSPIKNEFIVPGQYLLEIRHPDPKYHPLSKNVLVSEDATVELSETLTYDEESFRERFLNTKTIARVGLGFGAAAGYIWAVVENGRREAYLHRDIDKSRNAATRRNLGIIVGSLCVAGFQIVAFF
ncbi:hypothetical protein CHISP_0604 [Chitinispirillum alkaliphilum]|nr:hypothetical protein CHISP_0604 [Chitinispirillum alkaliphilum]